MKAVILAAGKGQRFGQAHTPKPLATLFGMSLLERAIRAGMMAGLREFIIVTGYRGEEVRKFVEGLDIENATITVVENPDWPKGNAVSLAAAVKALGDSDFIIMMADHLVDPEIIRKVAEARPPEGGLVMGVDRRTQGEHLDPDDATGVKLIGDRVIRVKKGCPDCDAVDVGVIHGHHGVIKDLIEAIHRGTGELNQWFHALAEKGLVHAVDVTGLFWIDIDTPRMLHRARLLLLRRLIKPTDGPVSRWLNRPISIRISSFLAQIREITPNHLSIASFVIAVAGGLLLLPGHYGLDIVSAVLIQFSSILDGCDGEIARLRYQTSRFGAWLDRVLDRYSDGFLVMMLTFRAYQMKPETWVLVAGGITMIGILISSYLAIPVEVEVRQTRFRWTHRMGRDVRLFLMSMGILFNRFILCLLVLLLIGHYEMFRRLKNVRDLRVTGEL